MQFAVAIGGCVPVAAGLAGVLDGPAMVGAIGVPVDLDSHFRYLSGLLLGIGLGFWRLIPRIETCGREFRLLTALVVAGGLSRALGIALHGAPSPPMLFGLAMELLVTPLLCLWQTRVATRPAAP